MSFTFEEVPLASLQEKPKSRQPSARQLRIQKEIDAVQETIKNAKASKKAFRVNLGDTKPATFRLRFAAAKKGLGRGFEKINLVTRNGELFVGPLARSRRGGRRRAASE